MKLRGYFNLDGWVNKMFLMNISQATAVVDLIFCSEDGQEIFKENLKLNAGELFILNLEDKEPLRKRKGIVFVASDKEVRCSIHMREEKDEKKFIEYRLPKIE